MSADDVRVKRFICDYGDCRARVLVESLRAGVHVPEGWFEVTAGDERFVFSSAECVVLWVDHLQVERTLSESGVELTSIPTLREAVSR